MSRGTRCVRLSHWTPRTEVHSQAGWLDRGRGRAQICEQLALDAPQVRNRAIAERIGWTRGITVLKARIAELRPAYLPPDPASRTQLRGPAVASRHPHTGTPEPTRMAS